VEDHCETIKEVLILEGNNKQQNKLEGVSTPEK
jgi:hypothetical protein